MSFVGLRHFGKAEASVEELQAYLEDTYCGHVSVETSQLSSLEEREWFSERFEELKKKSFSTEDRRQLAKVLLESQVRLRRRPVDVLQEVALSIQLIFLFISCVIPSLL